MAQVTREDLIRVLWEIVQSDDRDRVKAAREIACLLGLHRGSDYSDLEAELARIEAEHSQAAPSKPWYEQ